MNTSDISAFTSLINDVLAFYRQDSSAFSTRIWINSMMPFDYGAVCDAINRHCMNPDTGQFCPKPADIVRMLGGTSIDSAKVAWSKVERAMRSLGTNSDVVFDDPLIHRVVSDMGGWIRLGETKTEEAWVFVGNDFVARYRGFRNRSEKPDYPRVLTGVANAHNARNGFPLQPPRTIGDPAACQRVALGGKADTGLMGFHTLDLDAIQAAQPETGGQLRLVKSENPETGA